MTRRRRADQWGRQAETIAAWFLRLQGFRILDRRARTGAGELDLVAARGRALVFVEVKARRSLSVAHDAIGSQAQRRLMRAAAAWRARHAASLGGTHWKKRGGDWTARFDVVIIRPWRWPTHIVNAFGDVET